ncbi:MAG: (Fe-S)-binding protein, partial [Desulfovibrio sp.]|nr:(Fe-S)-binding protein [Desulfovibrio sp.]
MKSVASSLSSCSGCGQCQSACPVFRLTGVESDGPRGKISVIRAVADGDLTMEEAAAALSRCVLCGACSRACPAGVPATRAFEEARGRLKPGREKTGSIIFSFLAARPRLWNLVQNPLFQFRRAREYLPPFLARFSVPARERFAPRVPEIREGEKRVLLWGGCLASRQLPSILEACEAVITKAGFAVVAPDDLPCCGRPRLLAGKEKAARELARESLKLLAKQKFDFLVSPCAGCANAIKNTWPRLVAADEERKEPAENLPSRAVHIDDFAAKFLGAPAIPDQVAAHP